MFYPIVSTLFLAAMLGGALGEPAQQSGKRIKSRDAEIYEMYYNDTLTSSNPKKTPGKTPGREEKKDPKPAANRPSAAESPKTELPVSYQAEQQSRRVGLKYKIKHCNGHCEVEYVDASHDFYTGDEIRLEVEANIDGYLYIINRGSTGRIQTLFPHPGVNGGDNRIQRGVTYSIPAQGWIKFTEQPGEERVTFIVSRTPLQSIAGQPGASKELGAVTAQEVVEELNSNVKARDLVLVQERGPQIGGQASNVQSTLVVNQASESNNMVYTEIVLKHKAR